MMKLILLKAISLKINQWYCKMKITYYKNGNVYQLLIKKTKAFFIEGYYYTGENILPLEGENNNNFQKRISNSLYKKERMTSDEMKEIFSDLKVLIDMQGRDDQGFVLNYEEKIKNYFFDLKKNPQKSNKISNDISDTFNITKQSSDDLVEKIIADRKSVV